MESKYGCKMASAADILASGAYWRSLYVQRINKYNTAAIEYGKQIKSCWLEVGKEDLKLHRRTIQKITLILGLGILGEPGPSGCCRRPKDPTAKR